MQADYQILCDSGCMDYNSTNWEKDECETGKSASKAVVAKPNFKSTTVGAAAFAALYNGGAYRVAGEIKLTAGSRFANGGLIVRTLTT